MRRLAAHATAAVAAVLIGAAHAEQAAAQESGAPAAPAAAQSAWTLRLSAEAGAGGREVDLPMDRVVYRIRPGTFAALGLGFELDHHLSRAVTLGGLVRYQSSIGHAIVELHTDGSRHRQDLRSHRLELAFAPTFWFDASQTWALAGSVGYVLRNLRPEAHHLTTPAYTLAGPHLRPSLLIAPFGGALRLVIGPEVQWIAHVGQDLIDRGMAGSGVGLGGEAALEVRLGARFRLGATYREMRSWLDSQQAQRFLDVSRFVMARFTGRL